MQGGLPKNISTPPPGQFFVEQPSAFTDPQSHNLSNKWENTSSTPQSLLIYRVMPNDHSFSNAPHSISEFYLFAMMQELVARPV